LENTNKYLSNFLKFRLEYARKIIDDISITKSLSKLIFAILIVFHYMDEIPFMIDPSKNLSYDWQGNKEILFKKCEKT